jgi:uncharacterized protein YehS (DUF1456 family)
MTNNDVLRRLRYAFDFTDSAMIALFSLGGMSVTRAQVSDWLKKDEDPAFEAFSDEALATFLNGFIVEKRGRKDGDQPVAETQLTRNGMLRKLKIALKLQADDMLAILALAEVSLSKHELSALFRKPTHKHYRECQEQLMRGFLKGLQLKYRDPT